MLLYILVIYVLGEQLCLVKSKRPELEIDLNNVLN